MAAEMNALRSEMDRLKLQMARLAQVTDPSARRALIREHALSLQGATSRLHAMALQMIEDVDQGRMVSDRDLADRHRMLAEQNEMALQMLERAIECDRPSSR